MIAKVKKMLLLIDIGIDGIDVGIDGKLARLQFLTLEEIYNAATEKITQYKCNSFEECKL